MYTLPSTSPNTKFFFRSPLHCLLNWLNLHVDEINHFDTIGASREDPKYFYVSLVPWFKFLIISARIARVSSSFHHLKCCLPDDVRKGKKSQREIRNAKNWNRSVRLSMCASYLFAKGAYLPANLSMTLSENRLEFEFSLHACDAFLLTKKLPNNVGW